MQWKIIWKAAPRSKWTLMWWKDCGSLKTLKRKFPIQQNSIKNDHDENNNYNKNDEIKCATNYSFITNNKWNVNTHNNMQLTRSCPHLARSHLARIGVLGVLAVCVCCVFKISGGCLQDFWASPSDRPSAGPPKISLFLLLSPAPILAFSLGLLCETPAALGPPGFHTTAQELQTCTFERPGASIHEKTP